MLDKNVEKRVTEFLIENGAGQGDKILDRAVLHRLDSDFRLLSAKCLSKIRYENSLKVV